MATTRFQVARVIYLILGFLSFGVSIYIICNAGALARSIQSMGNLDYDTVKTWILVGSAVRIVTTALGMGGAIFKNKCLTIFYTVMLGIFYIFSIFLLFSGGFLAFLVANAYFWSAYIFLFYMRKGEGDDDQLPRVEL